MGVNRAIWLLSFWALGGFLKIAAYTWSETAFLVLLAECAWALHHVLNVVTLRWAVQLLFVSFALFLVRYVGGYVFGLLLFMALLRQLIPNWFQRQIGVNHQQSSAKWLTGISLTGFLFLGLYFWLNKSLSGTFSGGERILPTEPPSELALLFGRSLLNEFLFIRDFSPAFHNKLAWVGLVLQLMSMGVFYWAHRPSLLRYTLSLRSKSLSNLFILMGFIYVVVLFTIRSISPFSGPNARLMAPFSFCLLFAFFLEVGLRPIHWQKRLWPYWLIIVLLSWIQLLPQNELIVEIYNRQVVRFIQEIPQFKR
ncbi:hypothetical protein GCM10027592_49540 [Spirosoma flavus]